MIWVERVKFGVMDLDPDPAFQVNPNPVPDPRFE
jgi:hypothetical protein